MPLRSAAKAGEETRKLTAIAVRVSGGAGLPCRGRSPAEHIKKTSMEGGDGRNKGNLLRNSRRHAPKNKIKSVVTSVVAEPPLKFFLKESLCCFSSRS